MLSWRVVKWSALAAILAAFYRVPVMLDAPRWQHPEQWQQQTQQRRRQSAAGEQVVPGEQNWLFFDGVCNLCDGFVGFVADHDSEARVKFGAIQRHSELMQYHGAGRYAVGGEEELSTLVLVQNGTVFVRSSAALRTFALLDFPWNLASTFYLIPAPVRDAVYKFVATHRYNMFGQVEKCREPTPEFESRFLDADPQAGRRNVPFQSK